jgi:hypothetical protein
MGLRRFGPTGREVAVLGEGTWYIDRGDRAAAVAALAAVTRRVELARW